jgi:methionine aminopeptidase
MFEVGEVDPEGKRLITVTELCLKSAIEICKPNEYFCNIGIIYYDTIIYVHKKNHSNYYFSFLYYL